MCISCSLVKCKICEREREKKEEENMKERRKELSFIVQNTLLKNNRKLTPLNYFKTITFFEGHFSGPTNILSVSTIKKEPA